MASAQSRESLRLANEYRSRRHQLGEEIKAGEVMVSGLLREPELPDWLKGETAARLLCRIPNLGECRVNALLADLHIGQLRRLGDLTYRQRRQLSDELAEEEGRGHSSTRRRARRHRAQLGIGITGGRVGSRKAAA